MVRIGFAQNRRFAAVALHEAAGQLVGQALDARLVLLHDHHLVTAFKQEPGRCDRQCAATDKYRFHNLHPFPNQVPG